MEIMLAVNYFEVC